MTREVIKVRKRAVKPTAALQTTEAVTADSNSAPRMSLIDADRRRALIAEAAYYRSLRRVAGGSEIDDWLAAEQEVDSRLMAPGSR